MSVFARIRNTIANPMAIVHQKHRQAEIRMEIAGVMLAFLGLNVIPISENTFPVSWETGPTTGA
jgi:hypothetical protein